jgi:proton glutamate symport protein
MAAGTLLGWAAPDAALSLRPLANAFLRMIKSVIVPLVFGTLVVGIAGHGDDLKRVGRLAVKALLYFEVVTTLALAVGLFAVNLVRPGDGVRLPATTAAAPALASAPPSLANTLEHIVPQSVFEAAGENEVLQIVFWAVLFALALSQVRGRPKESVLGVCDGVAEVMFKFTGIVMRFAPIGVGAAIAVTVGHGGLSVLVSLGKLVVTLYGALVVFGVVVLLPVAWVARVPLGRFLRAVKAPALIAFSTTTSEAALPTAMEQMEAIGVPRRIVAFVMPTGYSFNLDGSTLYLAVASVFVAQAAGIALGLGQQLLMMFTLMVASKGVAGVPRASLVILSGTLASFHLPLEAIALLLGVDVVMDAARTTVNVVGNCLATVVLARWEGEYDRGASVIPPAAAAA